AMALEALQRALERRDRVRIQQLAQLRLAQELPQLRRVDRERLGAALRERRIAVVDEVRDVVEEQRGGEGRGLARVDRRDADLPRGDASQQVDEARQVEHVAQALAVGLEEDRERPVARRDREQVGGALALRPQRAAPAGVPPREQERARGVLT